MSALATVPTPTGEAPKPAQPRSLKTQYLIVFNAVSAISWLVVFWRALLAVQMRGYEGVHAEVAEFWKWTQTLAALEVAHAVFGTYTSPCPRLLRRLALRAFERVRACADGCAM